MTKKESANSWDPKDGGEFTEVQIDVDNRIELKECIAKIYECREQIDDLDADSDIESLENFETKFGQLILQYTYGIEKYDEEVWQKFREIFSHVQYILIPALREKMKSDMDISIRSRLGFVLISLEQLINHRDIKKFMK